MAKADTNFEVVPVRRKVRRSSRLSCTRKHVLHRVGQQVRLQQSPKSERSEVEKDEVPKSSVLQICGSRW